MNHSEFTLKIRVYLEDTDLYGVVHHANYVNFLERGRTEWLLSKGHSLLSFKDKGINFVVSSLSLNYIRPACIGDMLHIHTSIKKQKLSLAIFEQKILDENSNVVITATVKLASIDDQGKLISMPLLMD